MSDLAAAFLWPQLQESASITEQRRELWTLYHDGFAEAEQAGMVRRPIIPERCQDNAHMYYLLLPNCHVRDHLIAQLDECGINAVFHYIPLHSSPAGRRFGRTVGPLHGH